MATSCAPTPAATMSFERFSIAANEKTETERFNKPGARGEPDEAAGSVDAIIDDEDEAEIRKRGHAIWDAEGQPDRLELDHWLRARSEHPTKG